MNINDLDLLATHGVNTDDLEGVTAESDGVPWLLEQTPPGHPPGTDCLKTEDVKLQHSVDDVKL